MLQHVWSRWLRSTSVICHSWCMITCTDWLFLRGWSTTLLWRSIVVFNTGHQDTSLSVCALVWSSWSPASTICQTSTVCSTCSPLYLWKPCQTNSLDCNSLSWFAWSSCWLRTRRTFHAKLENTFIRRTFSSISALGVITRSFIHHINGSKLNR